MKGILLILSLIVATNGMGQKKEKKERPKAHVYAYRYKMIAPIEDTSRVFSDSIIEARFYIGASQIEYTIKNKSSNPLKVVWDEASIVILGNGDRIMHKGVQYINRNNPMPPTTILPQTTLSDLAVPSSNVSYSSSAYFGGWKVREIFPIYDMKKEEFRNTILSLVGQEISLYLPIQDINNKKLGYTFTFKVTEVVEVK